MKNTLLRHVRHLLLIGISTLSLAAGLAGLTVEHAHAASRVPSDTCYGASCYGKDPFTFGCLDSYTLSPDNTPEYYNGNLVGYFSSVYSYTCNANWNQATLTPDAISKGFRVRTGIATYDSQTPSQFESICYPTDCNTFGYGGETGWPTYSNMVDGTNTTYSVLDLVLPDRSVIILDSVTQ